MKLKVQLGNLGKHLKTQLTRQHKQCTNSEFNDRTLDYWNVELYTEIIIIGQS